MTATIMKEDVEAAFADVLAQVMKIDPVPVDGHFFDELGADSLVMAHFCARVRKRGDLPKVAMKDIYAHPTIRSLAAALANRAPAVPKPAAAVAPDPPTPARAHEYVLCGMLQALFYLGYSYAAVLAGIEGYQWIVGESEGIASYVRISLFSSVALFVVAAVPVAAKWLIIGRWTPRRLRIWSAAYLRFWIVKTLIRTNPVVYLLVGSPLLGLYLRALGAKVGARAVILSKRMPVCTDLITIGAGAVIRREVILNGYRARAGWIEIGPVTLGRDVYVGEGNVLDIDTSMGDGAQLGHSSALLSGQAVPAGERWHGSPAVRTETNYARVAPARCAGWRRASSAALTLCGILFLWAPLVEGAVSLLFLGVSALVKLLDPAVIAGDGLLTIRGLFIEAAIFSVVLFFGALLVGLLVVGTVPRLLGRFLKPDKVYPLYGFHYRVHRVIESMGRSEFLPLLFGDSSYVVRYLEWAGWRLRPVEQTGSNFGSEVVSSNPLLTSVGRGTMVADGLNVVNDEVSSTSFKVSKVEIGARNFIGNDVTFPAGAATGDNCLLALKAMVPIDGKIREGVGLLGSPPFEIPRSVERDGRFDHLRTGEALRQGLAAKNRFNLRTMGLFLFTRWLGVFIVAVIDLAAIELFYDVYHHAVMAGLIALSGVVAALYYAAVEGFFEKITPPPPAICSIYDRRFWWVERLWKLHPFHFFHLFNGTPFKTLLWRIIGVRVGRRVFDDGVYISEPTLTAIGAECVFNERSKIQCESQEDGTYKSGPSKLDAGCSMGTGSVVHYGVTMGDGAELAADAFLMKGEEIPPRARWGGNPAREL